MFDPFDSDGIDFWYLLGRDDDEEPEATREWPGRQEQSVDDDDDDGLATLDESSDARPEDVLDIIDALRLIDRDDSTASD